MRMVEKIEITIFWFRRDLRLHDNVGLYKALTMCHNVLPLFILDTEILDKLDNKEDRRVSFIYNSLTDIQEKLISMGSSMLLLSGKPYDIFEALLQEYNISSVYANHDYEPYSIKRDECVQALLNSRGVTFKTYKDQVIFEKSEIMKSDGTPYTVFTPYSRIWKKTLNEEHLKHYSSESHLENLLKTPPLRCVTIQESGFIKCSTISSIPIINKDIIINYHQTRDIPAMDGTTNLSTHLRFGTVSIRDLVKLALRLNTQWLNELIWREFFMMILYLHPNVVSESFRKRYDLIRWRNDEEELRKWCMGMTGYPMVDAGMRQLNETGLMHNRVRMVVASFLTKHLLIDWRCGEAYFAGKLLDYELSSNNGNWQWAAGCGCDAAPYFRIFNPSEQMRRYDPQMKYIRRWVPEIDSLSYPQPMVEHTFARERALRAYRELIP